MKALIGYELNELSPVWGTAIGAREEVEYLQVAIHRLYPELSNAASFALANTFAEEASYPQHMWLIGWNDESLKYACESVALNGRFLLNGHYWRTKNFGRKSIEVLRLAIQEHQYRQL